MTSKLTIISILCLGFFACKKSSNAETPSNTPLLKQMIRVASDGSVKDTGTYSYDAAGKISKIAMTSVDPSGTYHTVFTYTRNSSSVITHINTEYYFAPGTNGTWGSTPNSIGNQTVISDVSGNYKYEIATFGLVKDSNIYVYSNGRMSETKGYEITSSGIRPYQDEFFFYDTNGNILKDSALDSGSSSPLTLDYVETNTFDASISPLVNGYEILLADSEHSWGFNKNNIIKTFRRQVAGTPSNTTTTFTYTLNSNNTPATMTESNGSGVTYQTTYSYY